VQRAQFRTLLQQHLKKLFLEVTGESFFQQVLKAGED
jgi:hypothetical protein